MRHSETHFDTVKRFLDAMLVQGRDRYGARHTPLFVSMLDRATFGVPEETPVHPFPNIRPNDRVVRFGANVQYDADLYVALRQMTEATGDACYAQAMDEALRWFCDNCRVHHGLFAWGTHIHWNCETEQLVIRKPQNPNHELICAWPLWDVFWRVAPASTQAFCHALWERQILDHETGEFDRHYPPNRGDRKDFPEMAGRYIDAWAQAYAHTGDARFAGYIDVLLTRYERRRNPATGLIRACDEYAPRCWVSSMLVMAELCVKAAAFLPAALAARLREFGVGCAAAAGVVRHDLRSGILYGSCNENDGKPCEEGGKIAPWHHMYGSVASFGLLTHRVHLLTGVEMMGRMARDVAGYYAECVIPHEGVELMPGTFADLVDLYLGLYRQTGNADDCRQAVRFADAGLALFWDGGCTLPRASTGVNHYESITGGASLARALLGLHASNLEQGGATSLSNEQAGG